jgi:hypothetical protein
MGIVWSSNIDGYGDQMACRITELVLDARDPELLARFWCEVLGRPAPSHGA